MTGFETFGLYESLKLHFSKDSYDFFKYNGKTNHSVQTFENRKDKYFFYKLSRKFNNKDEMVDFLVANFLEDDKVWVGKLLDEQSEDVYRKRLKVIQSLSYTFENDCRNLFDGIENPNDLIHTDGDYPILLTKGPTQGDIDRDLCHTQQNLRVPTNVGQKDFGHNSVS